MVFEIQNELIFGYETFREGQVQRDYSARYKLMVATTLQRNIIYFYIKKDGTVAYKCWLGEHKEVQVTPKCISEIRAILENEKEKIKRFVIGACWMGMPINFIFENTGYGIRATDMSELSRTKDKFMIKPVFEKIFEVLYSEIPEFANVEKYPIDFFALH